MNLARCSGHWEVYTTLEGYSDMEIETHLQDPQ